MELVKPAIGLVFWMVLSFGVLMYLLSKYAWKPIMAALEEREETIQNSLDTAKKVKEEMVAMKSDHEKLLSDARTERDKILKEARELKEGIINKAKDEANEERGKALTKAKEEINIEKQAAITDLRNQVGLLSIEIAEKILKRELGDDTKKQQLVKDIVKDVNLN